MCHGSTKNGIEAGEAYVFVRAGSTWTQQARLTASDGAEMDWFGRVGIAGDTIIVGADQDDDFGTKSGSAYVFVRKGIEWCEVQKLNSSDADAGDEFGVRISMSGDRVLIGANTDDNKNGNNAGSAYVFRFDGSKWVQEAKLLACDGDAGDELGSATGLFGDLAVVGAKRHAATGSPSQSGQAYVFRRRFGSEWVEEARLRPSDPTVEGHFGYAVDISSDAVAVAAHHHDSNLPPQSGSAYVWNGNGIPDECECFTDLDGDGNTGIGDLLALFALWGPCPGPRVAGSSEAIAKVSSTLFTT